MKEKRIRSDIQEENRKSFRLPSFSIHGTPGIRTLWNFLLTALEPVGKVLYVYGGGWNEEDTGASRQACTLGIAEEWIRFFADHDGNYSYLDVPGPKEGSPARNPYGYAGLDCSGYVGWALYSTLETENHLPGYVTEASVMAEWLAERGWGSCRKQEDITADDLHPGDIVSMSSHVWISLGACADGSAVILHSSPTDSRSGHPGGGVQISAVGRDAGCQAYRLAERYMAEYFPAWHERYPVWLCDPAVYFKVTGIFRWETGERGILRDPESVSAMDPEALLKRMFRQYGQNSL